MVSLVLTAALAVCFAASSLAGPLDSHTCPNGFQYINGNTGNVMYDDRDIKTCDNQGAASCIKISYKYETPEALVNAEWDMPCFDPMKLPSFDLSTLFPDAALPLDINLNVCIPKQPNDCINFTPAANIDLFCDSGVVVVDTTNSITLIDDTKKMQCQEHQTGCFTMTQHFFHDGQSAMRMTGGCYDEWRSYDFIWNRFYPYTDFSGGFCEKYECVAFKVWHKDSFDTRTCFCPPGKKIPGHYGSPVVTSCEGSMCNSM